MKKHLIKEVKENSIAWELEIKAGDYLLSIDGNEIKDIFDYQLYCESEFLTIEIQTEEEIWEMEIEKDEDEDLGLIFDNGLMDEYQSCHNKCMFCFIDQMPPGMRDTLYFKDDDNRLSFLQGNYITLTNLKDEDIDRIIRYNLAPINISVHTMNKELRCKMLNNRFAGDKLAYIDKLYDAGLELNGQIVLCKGINDKEELEYTIEQLGKYAPIMKSVSVVPSGLTKFREGLYPLELFNKEDAIEVIETIEKWQNKFYEEYGIHFIHASDEWYIMAEKEMPNESRYDGYLQLENGVGMLRLLQDEANVALSRLDGDDRVANVSTFSGKLAYPTIKDICNKIMDKFPNVKINSYEITNEFFGHSITVTGLLTGQDIINQLKNKDLGNRLLIPTNTLKSGERVFLDDITVDDLEKNLQIDTIIVKSSGEDLINSILNETSFVDVSSAGKYEL